MNSGIKLSQVPFHIATASPSDIDTYQSQARDSNILIVSQARNDILSQAEAEVPIAIGTHHSGPFEFTDNELFNIHTTAISNSIDVSSGFLGDNSYFEIGILFYD